ncbi:ABC transporter ATP-binding/permease protein [Novipirellula aureliae]|uniref:ABC transporter ATP-binding/permease protein n=1 Tax=Novipirellula aureliae TaxID=2527966 RepID=A0A5C6DL28_9BACT|nr:ATP-binding cassette domain-containing protein [Novipirellula aureliae]TWU37478.1 ABC transporter ATP-binding/permease protein [Novipirellula aureliae]
MNSVKPHERCRMCRGGIVQDGHCLQCSYPQVQAEDAGLPPWPTESGRSIGAGSAWHASYLNTHPGQPWQLHIREGESKKVCAKEINYNGVLDDDTCLFLWCPPDQQALYVRMLAPEHSEDDWITIRGEVTHAGKLSPGDLLTIGSYPWVFHAYSYGNGFGLEAGNPLVGSSVELREVTLGQRLNVPALRFTSGQFVGIIGSSGSGKSTLIREIAETRVGRGIVLIDGQSRDDGDDPAMSKIAYVPQKDVVHEDLTVGQQTIDYVRLVNPEIRSDRIDESLRVVGLRNLSGRYPSQLSGGQLRRTRLAAAFARSPGVLLLDEPDSGLDPKTALDIRRLLRTFSLLGATVITVTHHRHGMDHFDRVLTLDRGRIIADSLPDGPLPDTTSSGKQQRASRLRQFAQIFRREWTQFAQRKFFTGELHPFGDRLVNWLPQSIRQLRIAVPQWILVGLVIPILFAISIGLALPTETPQEKLHPHLAGFLCVLSVIWMAASHSHLALTTNWHRIEYERQQGLRAYPFLAAKSTFLFLVTVIQTSLFFGVFWFIRHGWLQQPMFYGSSDDTPGVGTVSLGDTPFKNLDVGNWQVFATLIAVGLAASQLGLMISAIAKWRTLVAASILPLVMMVQILFSAFVIQAEVSDQNVEKTYAGFWWQNRCEGIEGCPSTLVRFEPKTGLICEECSSAAPGGNRKPLSEKDIDYRLEENTKTPLRFATIASYGTLTRYADISLRPIVKCLEDEEHQQKYGYAVLRRDAMIRLVLIAMLCHFVVVILSGGFAPRVIVRRLRVWVQAISSKPKAES